MSVASSSKRARMSDDDNSSTSSFRIVEMHETGWSPRRRQVKMDTAQNLQLPRDPAAKKQFSPEELRKLQDLKKKFNNALAAFAEVAAVLKTDDNGLPRAKDRDRNRYKNRMFSTEDARRELLSDGQGVYLHERMQEYVDFIDAACESRLDEPRSPRSPKPVANFSPEDASASKRASLFREAQSPSFRTPKPYQGVVLKSENSC